MGVNYLNFENSGVEVGESQNSEKKFPKNWGLGLGPPTLELKYGLRPPIARCQNCPPPKPPGVEILGVKI